MQKGGRMMTGVVLGPVVPLSQDMAGQSAEAGALSFAAALGTVDATPDSVAPPVVPPVAPPIAAFVRAALPPAAAAPLPTVSGAGRIGSENVSDMAETAGGAGAKAGESPTTGPIPVAGQPSGGDAPAPSGVVDATAAVDAPVQVTRLADAPSPRVPDRVGVVAAAPAGGIAAAFVEPLAAAPDAGGT
ncbi:MAG: hypothetical protein RIR62_3057, partial [Pseudomonadota bacterium]